MGGEQNLPLDLGGPGWALGETTVSWVCSTVKPERAPRKPAGEGVLLPEFKERRPGGQKAEPEV